MLDRLFHALVESKNEAADDVLLDALRLGAEREQRVALAALAGWVWAETRRLQGGESGGVVAGWGGGVEESSDPGSDPTTPSPSRSTTYSELLDQRPEIEAAVARAMDVHRGRHGQDLL